jgi:hypothetical protein
MFIRASYREGRTAEKLSEGSTARAVCRWLWRHGTRSWGVSRA